MTDFELKIDLPQSLTRQNLLEFSKSMLVPSQWPVLINFGRERKFTPTALILLVKIINRRRSMYPGEALFYRGVSELKYPNNLGFASNIGILTDDCAARALGGRNYLPISTMRRADLLADSLVSGGALGDAIAKRCQDIALVVSQSISEGLRDAIANIFCEIFRNTFEHARCDSAGYCVQYWPTLKRVEICVADAGRGVAASLADNPHIDAGSNAEALQFALMPGISSTAWRLKNLKAHQKTVWDNSGHGLFFAHSLFGKLGHFTLASGDAYIDFCEGQFRGVAPCAINGTLVSMSMSLAEPRKVEDVLHELRNTAFSIKEKIGTRGVSFRSVEAVLSSQFPRE